MPTSFSRRQILANTAAASVMTLMLPHSLRGAESPNSRINLAAIGCGSRASYGPVLNEAAKEKDVRIIATVDPFIDRAQNFAKTINEGYGGQVCTAYQDFREVIDRKDIDGVIVCTPDHWHVPIAIAAARAGKDMYIEKPLGLALNWAKKLREECNGKELVFQYGTQQRSMSSARLAVDIVRSGYIGEITHADVWAPGLSENDRTMESIGNAIPQGLNFDLHQGPSKKRPYSPELVSTAGSWYCYDHAIGFIAGWGAHPLDILQWGLNADNTGPVEMSGKGFLPPDGVLYDTVRTWDLNFKYANGIKVHFMDEGNAKAEVMKYHRNFNVNGTTFHGSEGWVSYSRGACYLFKNGKFEKAEKITLDKNYGRIAPTNQGHVRNFVDCMRSRQPTLNPLESAIRSDTISHLGNIVIRSGKSLKWDPLNETIVGGTNQQLAMMDREMRAPYTI
jgi:predicted dehydrogenase